MGVDCRCFSGKFAPRSLSSLENLPPCLRTKGRLSGTAAVQQRRFSGAGAAKQRDIDDTKLAKSDTYAEKLAVIIRMPEQYCSKGLLKGHLKTDFLTFGGVFWQPRSSAGLTSPLIFAGHWG
jgi:hypothetical protein